MISKLGTFQLLVFSQPLTYRDHGTSYPNQYSGCGRHVSLCAIIVADLPASYLLRNTQYACGQRRSQGIDCVAELSAFLMREAARHLRVRVLR